MAQKSPKDRLSSVSALGDELAGQVRGAFAQLAIGESKSIRKMAVHVEDPRDFSVDGERYHDLGEGQQVAGDVAWVGGDMTEQDGFA